MNRVFQHDLFSDRTVPQVKTESIKYIGSKLKIIPYILEIAMRIGARSVFDGFTGSTRVAQAFAQAGCDVVAADISKWSEVLAACYLRKERGEHIKEILEELNRAEPFDGWFTEKYGGDAQRPVVNGYKKPWQKHNTRKLDAIRERISQMNLPPAEEATALTSLMLAIDRVDNTLGHFASYLKEWSPRSFNHLVLKEPLFIPTPGRHRVERGDIFKVIEDMPEADLAYLDLPYGSNNEKMPPSRVRYASYYHIWTTVCLNDKPEVFGKALRRADTRDTVAGSVFEEFRRGPNGRFLAVEAIERLVKKIRAKHILLSYSSGGRAAASELVEMIQGVGEIEEIVEIEYKRNVMAGMKWTNEWIGPKEDKNTEYLFLLKK